MSFLVGVTIVECSDVSGPVRSGLLKTRPGLSAEVQTTVIPGRRVAGRETAVELGGDMLPPSAGRHTTRAPVPPRALTKKLKISTKFLNESCKTTRSFSTQTD